MPIEDGLDRLAKQILSTSRTYSVFDLARMVLQSRERFNVGLKAPKGTKMFRNITSSATFLTKEEALEDFWRSSEKSTYYKEIKKAVDAPSGNYKSVAKCQKSGVYLGPPNLHDYQTKLHDLHRNHFSTLPFEVFQRQIEILHGEEEVNAWLESEKFKIYYTPVTDLTPQEAPTTDTNLDSSPATPEEIEVVEEAQSVSEESKQEVVTEDSETPAESEELDDALLLKTRAELERHFVTNHFKQVYKMVQISWVPSGIPGRQLSPALLTLLKDTVAEERRYPGKLSSLMCRQLSGRNVAVFKVKKKLQAGPSRPHVIPPVETLSERPATILSWVLKNDGAGVDNLWKDLLSTDISEEVKAEWFHDLKWLLVQGFASLSEEGKLTYSKKVENVDPVKKENTPAPKAAPKPEEQSTVSTSPEIEQNS